MDIDKIEEGMLVAQEGMLINKIDIQVIFQLLIDKGIISREDVSTKRGYVGEQPLYKHFLQEVHSLQEKNKNAQKFSSEFEKILSGN